MYKMIDNIFLKFTHPFQCTVSQRPQVVFAPGPVVCLLRRRCMEGEEVRWPPLAGSQGAQLSCQASGTEGASCLWTFCLQERLGEYTNLNFRKKWLNKFCWNVFCTLNINCKLSLTVISLPYLPCKQIKMVQRILWTLFRVSLSVTVCQYVTQIDRSEHATPKGLGIAARGSERSSQPIAFCLFAFCRRCRGH
jgi:hypothetical protein